VAGDHLVSGLVPLAVLALAAAAYRRVRDGAGAAIALVLGYARSGRAALRVVG
jgi:hypothetical protein